MAAEKELERLVVRLVGDAKVYQKMLLDAQKNTASGARGITSNLDGIDVGLARVGMSFKQLAMSAAGLVGIAGIFGTISKSISLAAETEKVEASFEVMLNSASKAKDMVSDIRKFAAETPLESMDIQSAARTLMQFGVSSDEVIDTLRRIGDAAGGDQMRFRMLALAYGQSSAAGRLMGQDLLQMINAGFNPLQIISEKTGKSMADLKAQMEKGEISTKMVRQAFIDATSAGGKYFQMMQKGSKTLGGLYSTLKDNVNIALMEIGQTMADTVNLKQVIGNVGTAMQNIGAGLISALKTMATWTPVVKEIAKSAFAIGTAFIAIVGPIKVVAGLMKMISMLTVAINKNPITIALTLGTVAILQYTGALDALIERLERLGEGTAKWTGYKAPVVGSLSKEEQRRAQALHKERQYLTSFWTDGKVTKAEMDRVAAINKEIKALEQKSAKMKEVAEREKEAAAATSAYIKDMEEDLATMGLSPEEAALKKINMGQLTESQRANVMGLMEMKKEAKKLADAEKKAADERDSIMRKGKSLMEQYASPEQKFAKAQQELQKMLDLKAIDKPTFDKALEKAHEEAFGVRKEMESAALAAEKLSGIAYGSAEHLAELRNFQIYGASAKPGITGMSSTSPMGTVPQAASVPPQMSPSVGETPLERPHGFFSPDPEVLKGTNDAEKKDAATQALQKIASIAEKYWSKGTNLVVEFASLS